MSDEELSAHLPQHSLKSVTTKRKRLGLHRENKHSYNEVVELMQQKNYILLSSEAEYKNCLSPMRYICPKHKDEGEQITSLGHLLEGKGCKYCGFERTGLSERVSEQDVKDLCSRKNLIYVNKYMVSTCGASNTFVNFICPIHKEAGVQHMKYRNMCRDFIIGCKYCGKERKNIRYSKPSKAIAQYLFDRNIKYIQEYEFMDCKDIRPLPFDFYLPEQNKIIEYDGEGHYYPVPFNGISKQEAENCFNTTKAHDAIKNEYCLNHNIPLLRISYLDLHDMYNMLDKFIA